MSQRDPEALETGGFTDSVVVFGAEPPLRHVTGRFQMEEMPVVYFGRVGAGIEDGFTDLAHQGEPCQAGFFPGFP